MPCEQSEPPRPTFVFLSIAPMLAKPIRMLSSDQGGEIVASVRAMRRVLASVGLSLHDLANAIELPCLGMPEPDDDADDWRMMAKACAQCPHLLSEREISFVT